MSDDDLDVDALIDEHKDETSDGRHATEAAVEKADDDTPALEDAIADAYEAIDAGDVSSNLTLRDDNLAALFRGLEQSGRLADVGEQAADVLDRDDEDADSRSAVLRLLVRIGLKETDTSVIDAGKAGRKQFLESGEF